MFVKTTREEETGTPEAGVVEEAEQGAEGAGEAAEVGGEAEAEEAHIEVEEAAAGGEAPVRHGDLLA